MPELRGPVPSARAGPRWFSCSRAFRTHTLYHVSPTSPPTTISAAAAGYNSTSHDQEELRQILRVSRTRFESLVNRQPALANFEPETLKLTVSAMSDALHLDPGTLLCLAALNPKVLVYPQQPVTTLASLARLIQRPAPAVAGACRPHLHVLALDQAELQQRLQELASFLGIAEQPISLFPLAVAAGGPSEGYSLRNAPEAATTAAEGAKAVASAATGARGGQTPASETTAPLAAGAANGSQQSLGPGAAAAAAALDAISSWVQPEAPPQPSASTAAAQAPRDAAFHLYTTPPASSGSSNSLRRSSASPLASPAEAPAAQSTPAATPMAATASSPPPPPPAPAAAAHSSYDYTQLQSWAADHPGPALHLLSLPPGTLSSKLGQLAATTHLPRLFLSHLLSCRPLLLDMAPVVFASRLHAIMQTSGLPVSHLLALDPSLEPPPVTEEAVVGAIRSWAAAAPAAAAAAASVGAPAAAAAATSVGAPAPAAAAAANGTMSSISSFSPNRSLRTAVAAAAAGGAPATTSTTTRTTAAGALVNLAAAGANRASYTSPRTNSSEPHLQGLAVLLLLSPYHLAQRVEWLQQLLPHLSKEELFSVLLLLGHSTPQALHVRWQILQSAVRELLPLSGSAPSTAAHPGNGSSSSSSSNNMSSSNDTGSSTSGSSNTGSSASGIKHTRSGSYSSSSSDNSAGGGAFGGIGGTTTSSNSSLSSSSSSWAVELHGARGPGLASLLTAPHESLAQVTYLSATHQQQQLGLVEALSMSKAAFASRFPGYLDWLQHGPSVPGARQ